MFFYIVSYAGIQHSIDELATVSLTESILHGKRDVNRMEWEQERRPPQNTYGVDGNLYSKKGVGTAFAILPLFYIGKYWQALGAVQLAFLTTALVTAVTVLIFYLTARALAYSQTVSTVAALALGLGTLLWPYAQMLFGEPLAALGVALALLAIAGLWRSLQWQWFFLCGVGSAMLVLSRTANVLLVIPFMVALAYRTWLDWRCQQNWRQLLTFALAYGLPFGMPVLALILYNYVSFGTFFSFPTAEGEAFTTPIWIGVSGQLWSSGKGLVFYVPLAFMIFLSIVVDLQKMKNPIYLTAFFVILIPVLFYGKWYDWPGGKAWGPRFLVPTMPALVLLCLPTINWLSASRPKWRRILLAAWLLSSFLAQLPGVLVNFDYQEILDGKAGATYQDLLWNWSFSPLLTYWDKIFTGSANPVWLHSFFWENSIKLLAFVCLLVVIIILLHGRLAWWAWRHPQQESPNWLMWVLGICTMFLAVSVVVASREDLRWQEGTEDIMVNREVRAYIDTVASDSDMVVLDLQSGYDRPGRIWEWLNEASFMPDYMGYMRKDALTESDIQHLQNWLTPYPRIWLTLQATPYGAPESTTENWLRTWAYEGQNQWLDSQRVVEYLVPADHNESIIEGTAVFQTDPPLTFHYSLIEGKTPSHILLELDWENEAPWLNYSVQLMDAQQTVLLRQIDKPIADDGDERLGMYLSESDALLLLRVYDPVTQTIYAHVRNEGELVDHLLLIGAKSE